MVQSFFVRIAQRFVPRPRGTSAACAGLVLTLGLGPMPISSAICDIVTDRSPCLATRLAAVSRIASPTSRRCASIVLFQSLGTSPQHTRQQVRDTMT